MNVTKHKREPEGSDPFLYLCNTQGILIGVRSALFNCLLHWEDLIHRKETYYVSLSIYINDGRQIEMLAVEFDVDTGFLSRHSTFLA